MAMVLASGCAPRLVPVRDARPFEPPAVYRTWWAEIEGCAGQTSDFARVEWFEAPGYVLVIDGSIFDGYWVKPNRVVLPAGQVGDPRTVRHEMLHVVLQKDGHGPAFTEACRALVALPWDVRSP